MNATKNNSGKGKTTRRTATTKVTSTTSTLRKLASKTKDFKRNSERQTEISTDSTATNGFLKCRFLPKQEEIEIFRYCKDIINTERDFYKSLSKFSKQYHINPMQTREFDYPYNNKQIYFIEDSICYPIGASGSNVILKDISKRLNSQSVWDKKELASLLGQRANRTD